MSIIVESLRVDLAGSGLPLVSDISFEIEPGKVLGLVGESGSGKTTVALAMLGYSRKGTAISSGSRISIDGTEILSRSPAATRMMRSRLVSYVPQDPAAALNPALTVGEQLLEGLVTGPNRMTRAEASERIAGILKEVNLPSTPQFLASYPSQLSGGQQQRIGIAMAVAGRPRLIVLDEPTTGLDVSTQMDVLMMVSQLCAAHSIAAIYVSHDLAVISHVAHQVIVLYAGRIVEACESGRFFDAPAHPYSCALLQSLPSIEEKRKLLPIAGHAPALDARSSGCIYRERCAFAQAACNVEPQLVKLANDADHDVRCHFPQTARLRNSSTLLGGNQLRAMRADRLLTIQGLSASYGSKGVLKDVDLDLQGGECLAVVGESGSGKSTLSRCIVGLHHHWSGQIRLAGSSLAPFSSRRSSDERRRIQYVFQNPYGSLNPRRVVGGSIAVAVEHFSGGRRAQVDARVMAALERVSLPAHYANRYPNELSGGEKQRVAIARALVCNPDILVCDEVTSALDVSVQASIVELLRSLMTDGLGIIFVTHNLAVVRSLSDRVAVLNAGVIVEVGDTESVMTNPVAAYTQHLMAHTLELKSPEAEAA